MSPSQIDPEVIAQLLSFLRQRLCGRYRNVDEQLLEEAIEDALLHYSAHPEQFDASRGVPLHYYLEWRVRGYLSTKRRKEQRHRQHYKAAGVLEKEFVKNASEVRAGKPIYIGRDKSDGETEEQEREKMILDALVAEMNPRNQAGAQLLLAGASFEEWVQHLGIESLTLEEQQCRINKEKERLMKYLQRRAQKMQGGGSLLIAARDWATCLDARGERESWLVHPRMWSIQ